MTMPKLHPACAIFPLPPKEDIEALATDIGQNGLREPATVTPDGELLDGKVRWQAAEMVGVQPRTVVHTGDPISFVLSKNKHRRHLTKSQMAMVLARLANLQNSSNLRKVGCRSDITYSIEGLVKLSGGRVGRPYINWGRTVLRQGEPHIARMVDNGEVNIHVAAEAVRHTERLTQATWTKEDVEREGNRVIHSYPSNQAKGKKPAQATKPAKAPKGPKTEPHKHRNSQGIIDPPMVVGLRELTPEEIGLRPDATLEEKWAHAEKYGRVQLTPKVVKDLMNHDAAIDDLIMALISFASSRHPEPAQVFASIDVLLAWEPQLDMPKANGWHTDFAAKGRAHAAELEAKLPVALERLESLLRILKARKSGRREAHDDWQQSDLLLH